MSETSFSYDHNIPLPEGPADALPSPTFEQGQRAPVFGRPIFFHQARKKTQENGETVYENVECVRILTPGDTKAVPELKVTDPIRRKYNAEYTAWKQGLQVSQRGTPLEAFPTLTPALIMQLKAENIFTVEDLAGLPDSSLHRIHMGQTLKTNAKVWLESKKDSDAIERTVRENQALKDQMKMMEQQIADIARRQTSAQPAPAPVEQLPAFTPGTPWGAPEALQPAPSGNTAMADALSAAVDKQAAEPEKRKPGRPKKED